jgi:nitrogen fixation/metabolism regulation signal transduction histidine kinase
MGSFLFSRAVTRPIDKLVEATEKISEGRYDYRVEVPGRSELGLLARSFNAMVERIKEQLSQLTRAEKEVLRSEKLASLGRMASGIAHELGNPISALTGFVVEAIFLTST